MYVAPGADAEDEALEGDDSGEEGDVDDADANKNKRKHTAGLGKAKKNKKNKTTRNKLLKQLSSAELKVCWEDKDCSAKLKRKIKKILNKRESSNNGDNGIILLQSPFILR
jgi:hypothetical protein